MRIFEPPIPEHPHKALIRKPKPFVPSREYLLTAKAKKDIAPELVLWGVLLPSSPPPRVDLSDLISASVKFLLERFFFFQGLYESHLFFWWRWFSKVIGIRILGLSSNCGFSKKNNKADISALFVPRERGREKYRGSNHSH